MRRGKPPAFVRSALLQTVLTLTAAIVAVGTFSTGYRLNCTALVEFGILSAIVSASAGSLSVQYVIRMFGLLADYKQIEFWDARLRTLSYAGLATYAVWNGILDLALPRRDIDSASYFGLVCALVAVMMVAVVLETKYRVLQTTPSRSLIDSLSDDMFYLAIGVIVLATLVAHIFVPSWWLDTTLDAVFAALVIVRILRPQAEKRELLQR